MGHHHHHQIDPTPMPQPTAAPAQPQPSAMPLPPPQLRPDVAAPRSKAETAEARPDVTYRPYPRPTELSDQPTPIARILGRGLHFKPERAEDIYDNERSLIERVNIAVLRACHGCSPEFVAGINALLEDIHRGMISLCMMTPASMGYHDAGSHGLVHHNLMVGAIACEYYAKAMNRLDDEVLSLHPYKIDPVTKMIAGPLISKNCIKLKLGSGKHFAQMAWNVAPEAPSACPLCALPQGSCPKQTPAAATAPSATAAAAAAAATIPARQDPPQDKDNKADVVPASAEAPMTESNSPPSLIEQRLATSAQARASQRAARKGQAVPQARRAPRAQPSTQTSAAPSAQPAAESKLEPEIRAALQAAPTLEPSNDEDAR